MYFILNAMLELLKFYLIIYYGIELTRKKWTPLLIGRLLFVLIAYRILDWYLLEHSFLLYLSFITFSLLLLFQKDRKKLLLFEGGCICLIGLLDALSLVIIMIVERFLSFNVKAEWNHLIASLITLLFLSLVYFFILRKVKYPLAQVGVLRLLHIFFIGLVHTLILAVGWEQFLDGGRSTLPVQYYLIFFLIGISAYYQIVIMIRLAISHKNLQRKDEINQYFLNLQEKQYLYLRNQEQETRKFRHDIRHHMFVLGALCKKGVKEEVSGYIDEVWGKIDQISGGFSVGHSVVDSVLNQYAYQCKEAGINFKIKGELPEQCQVTNYDLCTLFSNLLQNAFEASKVTKPAFIHLHIRYDDFCIYIQEENSLQLQENTAPKEFCMVSEGLEKGRFKTGKKDATNHGFGLEQIKECINKYHGDFSYRELRTDEASGFLFQMMLVNKRC